MVGCSAMNCTNQTEKGYRFFKLPADNPRNETRRKAWLHNCRRQDVKIQAIFFCEVHFEESQWELQRKDGWIKLKQTAVPTIFNVPNPPPRFSSAPRNSVYKKCTKSEWNLIDAEKERPYVDRTYKHRHLLRDLNIKGNENEKENINERYPLQNTTMENQFPDERSTSFEAEIGAVRALIRENAELRIENAELRSENAKLQKKNDKYQLIITKLNEDVQKLRGIIQDETESMKKKVTV